MLEGAQILCKRRKTSKRVNFKPNRKNFLYLERTTPFQMLKDFFEGAEPTKKDFEVIEFIMVKHKLPPGVVNVLIYYVMFITNGRLIHPLLEDIATTWSRKKIKSVKEAMKWVKKIDELKKHKREVDYPVGKTSMPNGKLLKLCGTREMKIHLSCI